MKRLLKTTKGSRIIRSKYGVGKLIGGCIYLHKDYVDDVIPQDDYDEALDILYDDYPNFSFNTVKYDPAKNCISFIECPDFDTAREPVVGDYVVVYIDKGLTKKGHSNSIYHHKWLWVDDDYDGFDVNKSYEWSQTWLSRLLEPADGTNQARWLKQLEKYGLE